MKICLAPMEGVIDHHMRKLLTGVGGFDRCVTEFIRVTENVVPARVFLRLCPELESGGMTDSGVPVYVQLLGGDPIRLARSAQVAERLGALGIDLNFGCPAKVVNRHDGGSILLNTPSRIYNIVASVRESVSSHIPVTVKIRLGFEHSDYFFEVAEKVKQAGANELCIHARTKIDGYRPPAYWSSAAFAPTTREFQTIINGEIWNVEDAARARRESGHSHIMLGRGALTCPNLARQIRAHLDSNPRDPVVPMPWSEAAFLVEEFFHESDSRVPKYVGNRTKQWLAYLKKRYPQAGILFESIKRCRRFEEMSERIALHRQQIAVDIPASRLGNVNASYDLSMNARAG